ncbi:MAG: hypothetical protein HN522_06740 [Flavobacteriales bacterium]|jgi:hypothetical protein|nr:hypothetical protein [Flavobacteriales bacterium]MBT5089495.1 hypothetical protein [Flavobacteriales bacterium]MBT5750332.1 hypothetical protein [Flavobacteriales bacterium]
MLADFHTLPEGSRIWLYAAENALSKVQQTYILKVISEELNGWNAHKKPLTAGVSILENHFIVIALDESKNGASGCSIDTLQNTIQKIEKELSIPLMNRLNVFCEIEEEIVCVPSFKLGSIAKADTPFYDLTILTKRDIDTYLKPISEGWCAHLV